MKEYRIKKTINGKGDPSFRVEFRSKLTFIFLSKWSRWIQTERDISTVFLKKNIGGWHNTIEEARAECKYWEIRDNEEKVIKTEIVK